MQIKQRIEQQHRASEVITINELTTTTVTENTRSVLVGMDANVVATSRAAASMEATCRCLAMVVDRSIDDLSVSLSHSLVCSLGYNEHPLPFIYTQDAYTHVPSDRGLMSLASPRPPRVASLVRFPRPERLQKRRIIFMHVDVVCVAPFGGRAGGQQPG